MKQKDLRCKHCVHMYQMTTCSLRWCEKVVREVYAESLPCPSFALHSMYEEDNGSHE